MSGVSEVDALIVGAGIAGLYQLHLLRAQGLTTRVIEAGSDVGGTWYWSKYPGARCDIESFLYSYSFSPELEQEWTWTEKFTTQEEILRYVNHVADRFDLRKDITFNTRVTSAVYNEGTGKSWQVHTDTGETIATQFLILATGCLSVPSKPSVPGIETFRGLSFHTGEWPDEEIDFTGKRVGVIGTGSSGVQTIPIVAKQALELTVFQRTPVFCFLANNRPLNESEIAHTKANSQAIRKAQRNSHAGVPLDPPTQSALEVSDLDRRAKFEFGYQNGAFLHTIFSYTDIMTAPEANDTISEFVREKIRSIVRDPKIAETLSPKTYAFGTKRVCLESGYYEAFNSDHVHLVNLKETPIVEITPTGLRTSETEYPLDAIIYATGYDAVTGAISRIDIKGKHGMTLNSKWATGPRTYLGLATAGFPNLFIVTGPLSPSVFANMAPAIEQDVEWIANAIAYARENNIVEMEVTSEAEEAWVEHAGEVAAGRLHVKTESWYTGANVPGKPRGLLAYLGGLGNYAAKCDAVAARGYEGFKTTAASA